jgi:hypothetical protein
MPPKSWRIGALIGTGLLFGSLLSACAPAVAGSDNTSDTYAGDYTGGSLPVGTFIALQYLGYWHANAFIDSTGHELPGSHAKIFEEFMRFTYFTELIGRKLVLEGEVPFATSTDVSIPGTNNLVAGGLVDPVVHFTYFLIENKDAKRWLGLTNYFYLPLGRSFDNQRAVNVSTPRQLSDVLQIGYTEGLEKLSPALKGVFFDLIANSSFHFHGESPVVVGIRRALPFPAS